MLSLRILNVGSILSIGPLHLIGKVCSPKVVCDLKQFLVKGAYSSMKCTYLKENDMRKSVGTTSKNS